MRTAADIELLRAQPETPRAGGHLEALMRAARAAGQTMLVTRRYVGGAPLLILWGPGAPDRIQAIKRQVRSGGHVVALDLAYWQRDRKARMSLDAAHPQAWVLREELSGDRLRKDGVEVLEGCWDAEGPVVIAGIGAKARVQYGAGVVDAWEAAQAAECLRRWPGRRVLYKAKRGASRAPSGTLSVGEAPIEDLLAGASLAITWHSNVGVDAIRMGIPVVCRDGAAAAISEATIPETPIPLGLPVRQRFLEHLAWFQWASDEAPQQWVFLERLLAGVPMPIEVPA